VGGGRDDQPVSAGGGGGCDDDEVAVGAGGRGDGRKMFVGVGFVGSGVGAIGAIGDPSISVERRSGRGPGCTPIPIGV
jgi:hypothetical protein